MAVVSIAVPYDDRWFFAEVLRGARTTIEGAGHHADVHVVTPSATSTVQAITAIDTALVREDAIGAIVVGFKYREDQRERVLAWDRPVVVIGGSALGLPSILIDDIGAAWFATDHLMELGHTRIVHLAGPLDGVMDFSVHRRRARGYRLAMERAGLSPVLMEGALDVQAGYEQAVGLLEQPDRPSAIFAVSDEVAYPVLRAARHLGLELGHDLSVVGFDDHPQAEPEDLTTIRQRPDEQGAAAAELLLSGLGAGPDPSKSRLMPTSLVTRGSAGPLSLRAASTRQP